MEWLCFLFCCVFFSSVFYFCLCVVLQVHFGKFLYIIYAFLCTAFFSNCQLQQFLYCSRTNFRFEYQFNLKPSTFRNVFGYFLLWPYFFICRRLRSFLKEVHNFSVGGDSRERCAYAQSRTGSVTSGQWGPPRHKGGRQPVHLCVTTRLLWSNCESHGNDWYSIMFLYWACSLCVRKMEIIRLIIFRSE